MPDGTGARTGHRNSILRDRDDAGLAPDPVLDKPKPVGDIDVHAGNNWVNNALTKPADR